MRLVGADAVPSMNIPHGVQTGSKLGSTLSEVLPLRSTQFDDPVRIEETPEWSRGRKRPSVCESLKRLGYARDSQVRLYGQIFDLLSDPVEISENLVFVDAVERTSGQFRRVRIPRTIIQIARMKGRAA